MFSFKSCRGQDLGLASIGGEVRWNALGDLQLASSFSVPWLVGHGRNLCLVDIPTMGTQNLPFFRGYFTHILGV